MKQPTKKTALNKKHEIHLKKLADKEDKFVYPFGLLTIIDLVGGERHKGR
jgi:hypothetical protein